MKQLHKPAVGADEDEDIAVLHLTFHLFMHHPAQRRALAHPVVGRVVGNNASSEGMEINTVRRALKHEYSVELYWEGWRFFNLMRWYNNPNDPDRERMLDNLINKNAAQVDNKFAGGNV